VRIVVFGGTSAIAEHCLRLWAARGPTSIELLGRDLEKLERIAADLRTRSDDAAVSCRLVDHLDVASIERALAHGIVQSGPPDLVMIAQGVLPDQHRCERNRLEARRALMVNGVSPALCAEAACEQLLAAGRGTLVVIGSVAGDRGRRSNYIYGAAKGMLERYCEGLQHRLAGTAVRVLLVKPGPTATPMTVGLKGMRGKLAPVLDVARDIVVGVDGGMPVIYAPGRWRWIMAAIRALPRWIFHRLNF